MTYGYDIVIMVLTVKQVTYKQVNIGGYKMERTYRTKQETIKYFKYLSYEFEKEANRKDDLIAYGKAEAYRLAAFELEKNMK